MPTELLPAILSGAETTTKQIYTGSCSISCLGVFTNGSDDFSVTLYDGTTDSHKKIWQAHILGADYYGGRIWVPGGGVNTGIYAVVSGSNGWYVIEYMKQP